MDVHRRDRARDTRDPGRRDARLPACPRLACRMRSAPLHPPHPAHPRHPALAALPRASFCSAAARSRSTARSSIDAPIRFSRCSRASMPAAPGPWTRCGGRRASTWCCSSIGSTDVAPGLYLLVRERARLRTRCAAVCERDVPAGCPRTTRCRCVCLARGDCRAARRAVSVAIRTSPSDGFFSLGMIADFDASLDEYGPSFYRHLFWESGVVGQVLYLEAEAAGAARDRNRLLLMTIRCTTCSACRATRFRASITSPSAIAGRGYAADDRARVRRGSARRLQADATLEPECCHAGGRQSADALA